jgi:hypothetical protein
MGLFEPVANIRQQAPAFADGRLIAVGDAFLHLDQFRFHDPQLQIDKPDGQLQRGVPVGRCRVRSRARGCL